MRVDGNSLKREREEGIGLPPSAKRLRVTANKDNSLASLPDLPLQILLFYLPAETDRVTLKCSCFMLKERVEAFEKDPLVLAERILNSAHVCAFLKAIFRTFPSSVSCFQEASDVLKRVDKAVHFVMPYFSDSVKVAIGPIPSNVVHNRPDVVLRVLSAAHNRNIILLSGPYSDLDIDAALESEEAMRGCVRDLRAYFAAEGNKTMSLMSLRVEELTAFSRQSMMALGLRGSVGTILVAKMLDEQDMV